jgi:predicted TIM-barrel fold metal-dependent hydrolase
MAKTYALPRRIFDAHNHLRKDEDGSVTIASQEAFGVETTVVMGIPFGAAAEIRRINGRTIASQQKYPGRLVAGVYVDPRSKKKALDLLKHAHAEGVRLVKLFPNLGWFPDDEKFRAFFDRVAELKMGVLSHCGWLWPQVVARHAAYYSHPGRFEKVIRTHPDTPFIMAHMGGIAGFLESVMLTTRTPNTWVDCSPGQGLWVLESTGDVAASIPAEKLLWGADSHYHVELFEGYRKALVARGFGPKLEAIFRDNARGIFGKLGVL